MVERSTPREDADLLQGCLAERPHGLPAFDHAWALFLDFDGTITEIARLPGEVHLEPAVKAAVIAKSRILSGALAIISGRTIAEIDGYFAPLRLSSAGMHGAEIRLANGERVVINTGSRRSFAIAGARIRQLVSKYPGVVLEEKPLGLSLHYRAAPERATMCWDAAKDATRGYKNLDVRPGKMVVEIADSLINKGSALEQFMRQPVFRGRTPVYAGDDEADEAAIEAAQAMGGIGIRILDPNGLGKTAAKFSTTDARAVRDWLKSP